LACDSNPFLHKDFAVRFFLLCRPLRSDLYDSSAFEVRNQKRYPEAIRSLCEDEEHLLTFSAFPPVIIGTFARPKPLKDFSAMCAGALTRLMRAQEKPVA
jgi:hypothetical protein